jgi:putative FmdB family regulatory protein
MPIYEYRCSSCGHQEEHLQKVTDTPYTVCPQCSRSTYAKMVTAAGFQLKGTGWYATDFKSGSKPKPSDQPKAEKGSEKESKPADCGTGACPACE